jgi:hypothetical protein
MLIDHASLRAIMLRLFNRPSFNTLLLDTFSKDLDRYASAGNFENQVTEALQALAQENSLERLVLAAAAERPGEKDLEDIRKQIESSRQAVAGQVNPFDVVVLQGGRPFINRRGFRDSLRKFTQPNNTRVLVVRGESRTGRTYSRWFLQHFARNAANLEYVLIDLQKLADAKLDLTAYDLAAALNVRLKLSYYLPESKEREERPFKIEPFMLNMETALSASPNRPYLLVFDGFGHVKLTTPSFEIIDRLVHMAEETLHERLALVLLGYDRDLPADFDPYVCRDQTCSFSQDDLIEFVTQFYIQVLKVTEPNETVIATAVGQLLVELSKQPNVEAVGRVAATFCSAQIK